MILHCLIGKQQKKEDSQKIVLFKITASLTMYLAKFELTHEKEAKCKAALHLKMNTVDTCFNKVWKKEENSAQLVLHKAETHSCLFSMGTGAFSSVS